MVGGDRIVRLRGPWLERLLVIDEEVMIVRVREGARNEFVFAAEPVDPALLEGPGASRLHEASEETLELGIARMRFSIGVDEDLGDFIRAFRNDSLLGPALNGRLQYRPQRRPVAWEALLWAITEQLIEYRRAARIQRQIIRRFGVRFAPGVSVRSADLSRELARSPRGRSESVLATVPTPEAIAGAAPAELEACGLSGRRAIAMVKVAREVASGRVDPSDPAGDRRLLAISEIGPWTLACLALRGRGEPDALLAGDLAQVKLVGYLEGLGRLAEVEEVEQFYAPYAPWRGLAGDYLVQALGSAVHGPGNRTRIRQRAA
ncbi:MAG: DNA-3-methyladenine glycosylase 2 family protein [Actinomycetota bacterium]|jgi:3-methyladenine DNA glycosylase/8-oxoguanine DNA glycosylase|nr:DNA-3-methyladenine glycosylase 2 family protein [Actinomycetota bacterium]